MKFPLILYIVLLSFGSEAQLPFLNKLDAELRADTLSLDSEFYIIMESRGCFHHYQDSLRIFRTTEGIFAQARGKTLALNGKFLDDYRLFEFDLFNNDRSDHNCTTNDTYSILTKWYHIEIAIDRSCEWRGLQKLLDTYFKT